MSGWDEGEKWTRFEVRGDEVMVEMHCCGFVFSADHPDDDNPGNYSCPSCGESQARSEAAALRERVPRRGHYADLEVVAAILRSDPRERASGYDADIQSMAEAVENIIATFSPAALHPTQRDEA